MTAMESDVQGLAEASAGRHGLERLLPWPMSGRAPSAIPMQRRQAAAQPTGTELRCSQIKLAMRPVAPSRR
jgi:hypothetical protein